MPNEENPNRQSPIGNRQSTPYWYPFQTNAGAIRADRLVFPIPPGVRWQDVKAVPSCSTGLQPVLTDQSHGLKTRATKNKAQPTMGPGAGMVAIIVGGRIKYVPKPGAKPAPTKVEKPKRAKPSKPTETLTFDSRFLKQNRELRDRYLERVNSDPSLLEAPAKYDVSRALAAPACAGPSDVQGRRTRLLPAA